jgi:hypothetical protein
VIPEFQRSIPFISNCLPGGSQDILSFDFLPSGAQSFNVLRDAIEFLGNFNANQVNEQVDAACSLTFDLVNNYNSYKVFDFDSTADQ